MDYALVFGGGGGKGAYEIGVWKALDEMGYANRFSCVIGTSVGALNGALFCQNNIKDAEQAWLKDLPEAKISQFNLKSFPNGLLNQKGLKRLLEQHLPDHLPDTPDFYVFTSKILKSERNRNLLQTFVGSEKYEAQCIKMNGLSREEAIPHLLASAAIPIAYSPKNKSRDGGLLAWNNVAYHEAVCKGYEKVLAVSLSNEVVQIERLDICAERGDAKKYVNDPAPSENNGYSDVLILGPTVSLGGFRGLLDFSSDGAKWRMELGYENCMSLYRSYLTEFFEDAPKYSLSS